MNRQFPICTIRIPTDPIPLRRWLYNEEVDMKFLHLAIHYPKTEHAQKLLSAMGRLGAALANAIEQLAVRGLRRSFRSLRPY